MPSQAAKISALSSTAPPSFIHSVTDHNGLLKLLAVTGLDSPFMVTTARSAVSPKSQFGPVVTPESKLNVNAQRPPVFYAVVSAEGHHVVLAPTAAVAAVGLNECAPAAAVAAAGLNTALIPAAFISSAILAVLL